MADSPGGHGPVGILCAMAEEQELLVAAIGGPPPLAGRGLEARSGTLDGRDVVVAAAGVGKVRAATTATLLLERFGCRALVLTGVAGGLTADMAIGDLVIADRIIDIDYGRLTEAGRLVYQPGTLPLPGVTPRSRVRPAGRPAGQGRGAPGGGKAHCHARDGPHRRRVPGVGPACATRLAERWSALAIEMEGSAICGVAERFGVPWLVVRALSDRAGDESVADFSAFLSSAAAASAFLVRELLPVFDA